jgi:ribosomal protein L32
MAVPKRKVSKSRRDKRSTGKGLVKQNVIIKDGIPSLRHIKHSYIPMRDRTKKENPDS